MTSENNFNVKKKTLIPRVRMTNKYLNTNCDLNNGRINNFADNGKDSGLSSECTTPTRDSSPLSSRQSKILISSTTLVNTLLESRGKNDLLR